VILSLFDVEVWGFPVVVCGAEGAVAAALPPHALQASEEGLDRLGRRVHDDPRSYANFFLELRKSKVHTGVKPRIAPPRCPIPRRRGLACYSELRRTPLPRTRVNRPLKMT
jgi:hypothetical protein